MSAFRFARFVAGASVAGPAHVAQHMPNQDAFLVVKKRRYTLLVVSDGMGSKPHADVGSAAACRAVAAEVERLVRARHAPLSLSQLLQNIVSRWAALVQPYSPADCSATCLFLCATRRKILAARLGDGMICLLGRQPAQDVLLTDNKGDDFANASLALSDPQAAVEFSVGTYDRAAFCGAVLTSDGISADMEPGRELAFARDLFVESRRLPFWKRQPFLQTMLETWPVPHHTDDKTLLVGGLSHD